MSSRTSVKRTTVTSSSSTASQSSTSHGSTSQTQGRPSSPMSPSRISRLQEKNDLSNLNDRLAIYIDKVRHLETENGRLTREVRSFEEIKVREISSIKNMFEGELAVARKLMDEQAKELAKLEMDLRRLYAENAELNSTLEKKSQDLLLAEANVATLENRVAELQKNYNQAQADRKKLSDENKKLTKENAALLTKYNESKKLAEDEILRRVHAENLLQTTREDLNFRDKMYKQQMFEMEKNKKVEICEIDGRLNQEYEEKLYNMLQDARADFEDQLRQTKEEASQLYQEKIKSLELQVQRSSNNAASALDEMRKLSSRQDEWQLKCSELEQGNAALTGKLRDLEKQLENERSQYLSEYNRQERELNLLHNDMQKRIQEYQDLMDIKVHLDMEISHYRKLLESEEARLNITPVSGSPGRPANVSRSTPGRRETPVRGGKRKRAVLEDSEMSTADSYTLESHYQSTLEIVDVDVDGKYIKIQNKGEKEITVGKWQVITTTVDGRSCTYKFRANTKVKAGDFVTVWSSASGHDHEPPHHLVMSEQQWAISDQMKIQLLSPTGEELGFLERKLAHTSHSRMSSRQPTGELYEQEGDGEPKERCAIM